MNARVLKSNSVSVADVADPIATAAFLVATEAAFSEGVEHGRALAGAQLATCIDEFAIDMDALDDTVRRDLVAAGRLDAAALVDLALELASWFIDVTVPIDVGVITDALTVELDRARPDSRVTIHVHPDVREAVAQRIEGRGVDLRADATMALADYALVVDETSTVRSWAHAIEALRPELTNAVRGERNAD